MKPVIYALLAVLCYAVGNVILELKLSRYNNLILMVCYIAVVFAFSVGALQATRTSDPSYQFPTGSSFVLVLALGLLYFAADYFYIGAYTNGGNLLTITSLTLLVPVLASLFKYGLSRELPNLWQVGGYLLAAAAVALIVVGNNK